ncbi:MAG TPA: hypothetical protein VGG10_20740 [Rhizomicrobium sp.]
MSTDNWKIGLNGNWANAALWSSGVPTSASDVTIDAFGTYRVSITANEGTVNSLTLNAAGATLAESAAGSLTIANDLDINAGTVILNGFNVIDDDIRVNGGTVVLNGTNVIGKTVTIETGGIAQIGSASALSTGDLVIGTGKLLASATETLGNKVELDIGDAPVIAAAHGKVLTLSEGNWAILANSLTFGAAGENGTVVWDTKAGASSGSSFQILIQAGTLQAGDTSFGTLFTDANSTTVGGGARIDLVGASSSINDLEGTGIVTSSGGATLTLTTDFGAHAESIAASFRGLLSLDVLQTSGGTGQSFTFTGDSTYTGSTTIESLCVLTVGDGGTSGTLGTGAVEDDGNLFFDRSGTVAIVNTVLGSGDVIYHGTGTYVVNHTNSYTGGTIIDSGTYETNTAASLSSGAFSLGSEFIATANMAIHNGTTIFNSTFAAAHGKTLTLAFAGNWTVEEQDTHIVVGDTGDDGTVVWQGGDGTLINGGTNTLEIRDGTLTDGDGTLGFLLSSMETTTIDAGATLSLVPPQNTELNGLLGTGTLASASGDILVIAGAQFGGTFQGGMNLQFIDSSVLTGDSTDVGNIQLAGNLSLGDGGTTGSLGTASIQLLGGALIIDHSNAFALTNDITGGGNLRLIEQLGTGITTIDRTNSYTGGTLVGAGELSIDRAAAIGSGALDLQGGELLVTGNVVLQNSALNLTGDVTIASATGEKLALEATSWSVDAHSVTFGDATNHGTIVWHTPAGSSPIATGDQFTVDIASGTMLKEADGNLGELLGQALSTTIEAGATLNVGAFSGDIGNLLGSGIITGTGGTLDIGAGSFSGRIEGGALDIGVLQGGNLTLSGNNTFTGEYDLFNGAELTLNTAASQNAAFEGDATLVFVVGKAFSGTVSNFDNVIGQTMDFAGLSFANTSEHFANGVLTMTDGTHTEHVKLAGTFADANFALSDDHHGGTDVNYVSTPTVPLASDQPPVTDFG